MQYINLHNGVKMPILGLGTDYQVGRACIELIYEALKLGYSLIDTAQMYRNELEVGEGIKKAIKDGVIKREEVFVETKLLGDMDYTICKKEIDERLQILQLDYIDLLLIHYPNRYEKQMWQAMQDAYKEGKLRAIGVSNFIANYDNFVQSCEIKPMLNQLEVHVFHQRKDFYPKMQKDKMILQAWSPFVVGKNNFFHNELLIELGKKHNKTVAQIALRWFIQRGINVIPRTNKREKLLENLDVFDFALSDDDMEKIATLDTNKTYFGWYE